MHEVDDRSHAFTADQQRILRAVASTVGAAPVGGNEATVLRNGDEIFPAMLSAIEGARRTVDLVTFVYWSGDVAERFADALADRARAGVRVRVLIDAIGGRRMGDGLVERMRAAGVDVRWFRPASTWRVWHTIHRTHRKVLVCDDEVAFTGGVGIADEWDGDAEGPGSWRDTHVRFTGPVVQGLRAAFVRNWIEEVDPPLPVEPAPAPEPTGAVPCQVVLGQSSVVWSDIGLTLRALIASAHHTLNISTAYLSPDEELTTLLEQAVRRGVRVTLLVPGPHCDKRVSRLAADAWIDRLVRSGVEVWRFQPSMFHAKVITVDGSVAMVGSANLNGRSVAQDDEVGVIVYDTATCEVLDRHLADDLRRSERMRPGDLDQQVGASRHLQPAFQVVRRWL